MRRVLVIVASALALAVSSVPAGAITGGQVDTGNDYPFVGMLAFYDGDGAYVHRCTGTLMSATVVLTAGHCTEGTDSARAYFDLEVTSDYRNAQGGITGTPITHPGYNSNTLMNDVAVVELDAPVSMSTYPVLPTAGFLSRLKRQHRIQDDTFVAVGYGGVTGFPPPNISFDLLRRFSVSPYGSLTRNNLHLQQNPNAIGDDQGGTCFGDSGGPHFWKRTLKLVSVTSWGDNNCRSNDMTQRTDTASVLGFLAGFGLTPA